MFNNIGKKVKILAWVEFIVGIILSIILGIATIIGGSIIVGLISIVLGVFVSWLATLALYAIGQTAENTEKILEKMHDCDSKNILLKGDTNKTNTSNDEGWICSCGAKNNNLSTTCLVCFKSRPHK